MKDEFEKQTKSSGDCILWTGPSFGEDGYGVYKIGDIRRLAHRESFRRSYGFLPAGRVLQICGKKNCVNCDHLREEHERPI